MRVVLIKDGRSHDDLGKKHSQQSGSRRPWVSLSPHPSPLPEGERAGNNSGGGSCVGFGYRSPLTPALSLGRGSR